MDESVLNNQDASHQPRPERAKEVTQHRSCSLGKNLVSPEGICSNSAIDIFCYLTPLIFILPSIPKACLTCTPTFGTDNAVSFYFNTCAHKKTPSGTGYYHIIQAQGHSSSILILLSSHRYVTARSNRSPTIQPILLSTTEIIVSLYYHSYIMKPVIAHNWSLVLSCTVAQELHNGLPLLVSNSSISYLSD